MMTAAATIQAVLRPGDRVLELLRWQNFDTSETLAGKTAHWVGRLVAQLLVLFSGTFKPYAFLFGRHMFEFYLGRFS